MALTRKEMFLASQFDEFRELRRALRERLEDLGVALELVDLDDGCADPRPVMERSLARVRQADFMLLLVGQRYSEREGDDRRSYTHVEYDTAVSAAKDIFVFFIDETAPKEQPDKAWSTHPLLAQLQASAIKQHVVKALSPQSSTEDLADAIYRNIKTWFKERSEHGDGPPSDDAEVEDLKDLGHPMLAVLDISYLERSDAWPDGIDKRTAVDLLARPLETAAAEHAAYACRAIRSQHLSIAARHLSDALKLRPLHVERIYWRAYVLTATHKLAPCRRAITLARQAGQLAEADGNAFVAGACYVVGARAARHIDETDTGLTLAKTAHAVAPWVWITSYELACQYAKRGEVENALACVTASFELRPGSILRIDEEPSFKGIDLQYKQFKKVLRTRVLAQVRQILGSERGIQSAISSSIPDARHDCDDESQLATLDVLGLVALGRRSARRQLNVLRVAGRELAASASALAQSNKLQSVLADAGEPLNALSLTRLLFVLCSATCAGCLLTALAGGNWLGTWARVGVSLAGILALIAALPLGRAWRRLHGFAERAVAFVDAVGRFERTCVAALPFSPTRSIHVARNGELARLPFARATWPTGLREDTESPPPSLHGLIPARPSASDGFGLFRVRASLRSDAPTVSHWAAYFE